MTQVERVADVMAPVPPEAGHVDASAPDHAVRLALSLAETARDLAAGSTVSDALERLVERAVELIDGCDEAGVSVARPGWWSTAAATGELVGAVDGYQYAVGRGPCLDALREHEVFVTGDLAADPRWPEFGARAAGLGVRSMLSFRLFAEDDTFGSLNLYSRRRDAFDGRAVHSGAAFAAHAGLALALVQDRTSVRNLERALETNRTVSMAIGVLVAVQQIDEDTAFELLRSTSQRLNRKLRTVAADVVRTGALPD